MEGPLEPSSEAVVRFLAERGGRARHSELVQHFRDALGGQREQRVRAREHFKELVNAVATVRTDPADGTKYVHLKKRFRKGGSPPIEASLPQDPPRIEVTEEPEVPDLPAEPCEGSRLQVEADPQLSLGLGGEVSDPEPLSPAQSGAQHKDSPQEVQAMPWASVPGPSENLKLPPHGGGGEEAEGGSSLGGPSTPRSARQNFRDLVMGSSPQLKRSLCPGDGSAGSFSVGGRSSRGGGDSDSASLASSSAEDESTGGGSVTLDPLEHAWMLSASEGKWDSLEGLLTCEPGLLSKRDFITGFTCLHWAAKHGRQELLAMLVNFASKHHLPVNINAKSSGGYTALHLAAMHGHVEVVKLLVGAYDADVDIRDYSGKKASQYLSESIAEEIKNLVGSIDEEDGDSGTGRGSGRWRLSKVLPSHILTYKLSQGVEDGTEHHHHHHHHIAEGWTGGKAKDSGRKALGSSSGRMKPRLNKIRFRTQIIHTTPSFKDAEQTLEEEEEEEERSLKGYSSFKLRPKSNVFGSRFMPTHLNPAEEFLSKTFTQVKTPLLKKQKTGKL
ncbi:prolyl 4-hydroxylase subunit alpha-1 isoform X2 [Mesocricetus auratus]|uniref:Prolyl 4-hydroxylase subunit alpha-1 isoform X2 n=1 Tax=Mesocricetus auratus TaxID=10036 RepID=A0ABM2WAG6_MESAU|nr:prolyl 4-hydroxylase subunit alpha-1 isoform X2 [Mesocricetus auratus]